MCVCVCVTVVTMEEKFVEWEILTCYDDVKIVQTLRNICYLHAAEADLLKKKKSFCIVFCKGDTVFNVNECMKCT